MRNYPNRIRPFRRKSKPIEDRFVEKFTQGGPDECWPWHGATGVAGHGQFFIDGIVMNASRASWILNVGPIENSEIHVCHKCDNPPCVNPAHLFLGSHADNMADMRAKGRMVLPDTVGEANPAAILYEIDVLFIRSCNASLVDLSFRFGVSKTTIWEARSGRTWPHLPMPNGKVALGKNGPKLPRKRLVGNDNPSSVLTEGAVRKLRDDPRRLSEKAKAFGISKTTAYCAITRKTWKHVI